MPTRPTSVRIDTQVWPQLVARAKRAGMSPAEFIREATYEKLEGDSRSHEVENLRQQIDQMRGEIARFARTVLIVAGSKKEFPEELADEWITKVFGEEYAQPAGGSD